MTIAGKPEIRPVLDWRSPAKLCYPVSVKSCPATVFAFGLVLAACQEGPPPAPSGRNDGAIVWDSGAATSSDDAGQRSPDGAVLEGDAATVEGRCSFEAGHDLFRLTTDREARDRLVRVAAGPSGWAIVWADLSDGFHDVRGLALPSTGSMAPAVVDLTGDPFTELDPAIARAGNTWLVAYASNAEGAYEVYTRTADEALSPTGEPSRLTNTATREDSFSVAPVDDGYLLSWVRDDMVAETREVFVQALRADFSRLGSPRMTARMSLNASGPQLATVGDGAALAFVRTGIGGREIALQMLRRNGSSIGDPVVVADAGVEGTVDLVGGSDGGAIVFGRIVGGSRTEVRFRAFDEEGRWVGGTGIVSGSPSQGRDASIASFAGSYVVAYRRVVSAAEATLVVALLDGMGDVVEEVELVPVSATGGRTTIAASGDGHLLVAFAHSTSDATEIVAARLRCE